MDGALEEARRIVVRLRLDVLREGEEGRAPSCRVEHHGQCLGERLHDLLGSADAIPVPSHGLECVGHRDRRVLEHLDLLEHGIDDPVLERVP